MKMKLIVWSVLVLQSVWAFGKSEGRQATILVKPGSGTLLQAIRKAASLEGDVIIEMKGGEYRTDKTIGIHPGKWSSLLIKAREGEKVSVSGDKVIPLSRIRQVKDQVILSRLQESVRGKVVEVDCKGIVEALANIRPSGFGRSCRVFGWMA
ncbi:MULTISPECIES: hypothetical protein [Parabacteroides]|uniref:hypothetical protein n=2 Tax=Parabacteroides TaxID=375288 RepID=UPI001E319608|nr:MULTISPECIES: hypothetical protein [Parabacteroides]MCL3853837.1 hypothetical protein [Parabacteroides leei]